MTVKHASMRGPSSSVQNPVQNNHYVVEDVDPATYQQEQAFSNQVIPNEILNRPVQSQAQPQVKRNSVLEKLIFLGRNEKEVNIEGIVFKIATLNNRESTDIIKEIYSVGDASDIYLIRTLTLAQAIKSIDDIPMELIQVDGVFDNEIQKRRMIVESMQTSIINKLMTEYDNLGKEVEDNTKSEEIKK